MAVEADPAKQREMSQKIFDAMDADHDRSLDKKEMTSLVEAFWKAIPAEMKDMMKFFGTIESEGNEQMNDSLFKSLDADGDGKVTFDEWHAAFTSGALTQN
jgi:Ca2+-binding EF-hand superfamily protein